MKGNKFFTLRASDGRKIGFVAAETRGEAIGKYRKTCAHKIENMDISAAQESVYNINEFRSVNDQLKETFIEYVNSEFQWGYFLKCVERDMYNGFLTEHETDDGKKFLHYLDENHEFIVLPGYVLEDESMKDYTKFVY